MEQQTKTRHLTEAAQCSKVLRQILKKEFPTTKFKVQSSNYSMGNSVNIYWTDGPCTMNVEKHVKPYQYEKNYDDSIPQARFVFCNRTISEVMVRKTGEQIAKDYQIQGPGEDLGSSFDFGNDFLNWYQLAWKILSRRDI